MLCINACFEDRVVGLEFMDLLYGLFQKPRGGIEPLEQNEQICKYKVQGMSFAYVGQLVDQDILSVLSHVLFRNHYVAHPAEGSRLTGVDKENDFPANPCHFTTLGQQTIKRGCHSVAFIFPQYSCQLYV